MMKFHIVKEDLGRLGDFIHPKTGEVYKTPMLMQSTKSGSVPFLSREVFEYITKDTQFLQMSLATMNEMANALEVFKGGLSAYVGFKGHHTMLMIRDICEITPDGFNDKNIVPLFTRQGKVLITAKRYMELVKIFSPDIYQSLCDSDTNAESSGKRVSKSVQRSSQFFDYCYEEHKRSGMSSAFFASIVGGFNKFERSKSIKHVSDKTSGSFDGYILEGFHKNGSTAIDLQLEQLLDIVSHCVCEMIRDKPKMITGAYGPSVTLELVRLGLDIFDTSYAFIATQNFIALTFNFNLDVVTPAKPFLELSDEGLRDDLSPFLENCTCYACKNHTKAYVYHLYNTKELLGSILIMIHNIHHYVEFFQAIRESISSNKLPDLIHLIKFQSTETEVDYKIKKIRKHIPKTYIQETMQALKEEFTF